MSLKGLEAATQNRQRAEGWLSTHGYVKRKRKRKKIKVVFSDSLDTKVGIILLSTNTVVCFSSHNSVVILRMSRFLVKTCLVAQVMNLFSIIW